MGKMSYCQLRAVAWDAVSGTGGQIIIEPLERWLAGEYSLTLAPTKGCTAEQGSCRGEQMIVRGAKGDQCDALGGTFYDFFQVGALVRSLCLQERIRGFDSVKATVDDPGVGLDAGAPEIFLKKARRVYGSPLREGDDHNFREIGVA